MKHTITTALLFHSVLAVMIALPQTTQARTESSLLYSSRGKGLEAGESKKEERVYTLHQIERLSRAISPRFITLLDWRYYGTEGVLREGILFTVEAKKANEVMLSGTFNNWNLTPMIRNERGVYFYILPLREDENGNPVLKYDYKFRIDGIWTHDRANLARYADGMGAYYSRVRVPDPDPERNVTVRVLSRADEHQPALVQFRIYLPEVRTLTIAGSFNHWNPDHDYLKKGRNGFFSLYKKLPAGRHCYNYIADGKWILDKFNPETGVHPLTDERVSCIEVQEK